MAEKLENGVEIVLKNRHLFPKADLTDVDLRRSEFNAIRKQTKLSAFGSEYVIRLFVFFGLLSFSLSQFKRVLLTALGRIINEDYPEDFEPSKFMVKANGNPTFKLKTALTVYFHRLE